MTTQERAVQIHNLLIHFTIHGISHEPKKGLDEVLKFQDLVGQASMPELCEIEVSFAEEQRRRFVWALFSACGYDSAISVFQGTIARRKITEWYEDEVKQLRADQDALEERSLEVTRKSLRAEATLEDVKRLCKEADDKFISQSQERERQTLVRLAERDQMIEALRVQLQYEKELSAARLASNARLSLENNDLQAVKRVLTDVFAKVQDVTKRAIPL